MWCYNCKLQVCTMWIVIFKKEKKKMTWDCRTTDLKKKATKTTVKTALVYL